MNSSLFPPLLPDRPRFLWVFLLSALCFLTASFSLKAPALFQSGIFGDPAQMPLALADLSACGTPQDKTSFEQLRRTAGRQFTHWSFQPLERAQLEQALLPLNPKEKTLFLRDFSGKILKLSTESPAQGLPALSEEFSKIEHFFQKSCSAALLVKLPFSLQKKRSIKAQQWHQTILSLSHFFSLSSLLFLIFTLFLWGSARFNLSSIRLAFLSESELSAFQLAKPTLGGFTLSFFAGLATGHLTADLFTASLTAKFSSASAYQLLWDGWKAELGAIEKLSVTPEMILTLCFTALYSLYVIFFLRLLGKKLQKQRKRRIFLSENPLF